MAKPNGNQVVIEVKSDNGLHVIGFSIFPPATSEGWEIYENDGRGNGSHFSTMATFERAMNVVTAEVQRVVETADRQVRQVW
jgi:hypothetical protein